MIVRKVNALFPLLPSVARVVGIFAVILGKTRHLDMLLLVHQYEAPRNRKQKDERHPQLAYAVNGISGLLESLFVCGAVVLKTCVRIFCREFLLPNSFQDIVQQVFGLLHLSFQALNFFR